MDLNKYVKLHILSDLSPTDHLYRWALKILWRRDARTIQAAKKRLTSTIDRQFNEDLQYYELKYCCIKGGGGGGEGSILQEQLEAVPTHQLFEVNAELFQIRLRVTKDGQYLEIVTMNKDHNHDINSASFNLHPARRILANEEKQQVS